MVIHYHDPSVHNVVDGNDNVHQHITNKINDTAYVHLHLGPFLRGWGYLEVWAWKTGPDVLQV